MTIWRWLHEDAIRPWSRRSWVFPRDPKFRQRAGPVLDLYHRRWRGEPLGDGDFVLSADEKTQLQIRSRLHPTSPPAPGRSLRVEHEYRRHGTCVYQAAWDVHRAQLFGQVVERNTIETFDTFVARVMQTEPYASADRVFWIVDNGTVHRGQRSVDRLQHAWPTLNLVHLPVHASWIIRSRSTSPCCSEKRSCRTTSSPLRRSRPASLAFSVNNGEKVYRSNGLELDTSGSRVGFRGTWPPRIQVEGVGW